MTHNDISIRRFDLSEIDVYRSNQNDSTNLWPDYSRVTIIFVWPTLVILAIFDFVHIVLEVFQQVTFWNWQYYYFLVHSHVKSPTTTRFAFSLCPFGSNICSIEPYITSKTLQYSTNFLKLIIFLRIDINCINCSLSKMVVSLVVGFLRQYDHRPCNVLKYRYIIRSHIV